MPITTSSIQTCRTAVLLLAGIAGTAIVAQSTAAADRIYVSNRAVYDDPCDEPGSGCNSLCRKFKLHCVYCRRACSQKYIALPYIQPDSTIYIPPHMNGGGYGNGCPPPAPLGALSGQPAQYGYGISPAYAPPNSIFIR
jgi:hypothetical protein